MVRSMEVRAIHPAFTGVGEPKLITSLTMSAGSKENCTSGNLSASRPEPLLEFFDVDPCLLLEGDPITTSSGPPVH